MILRVIFDSQLSLSAQVSAVCCTGYYQLQQLYPFVRCLSVDTIKTLIQAVIYPRLDCCDLSYFSIADGLMSRLPSVQNAAAHLITGVRRCEHITPVLCQLHWLPVCRRVEFKISTLVYRSLAGTAPVYLTRVRCSPPLAAAICCPLTVEHASSSDHATSSVTDLLPPPVQRLSLIHI